MSVQNLSLPFSVAGRLVASVRSRDTVSRQGGDEFMILRPPMAQAEDTALSCVRYRPDKHGRSC